MLNPNHFIKRSLQLQLELKQSRLTYEVNSPYLAANVAGKTECWACSLNTQRSSPLK